MQSLYDARLALAKAEYEALVAKRIEELNVHQAEFKHCADAANKFIGNKSLPCFDAISHDKFMHDLQHIKAICKKSRYWKFVDNKRRTVMLYIYNICFDWEMTLLTGGMNAEDNVVRCSVLYVDKDEFTRCRKLTIPLLSESALNAHDATPIDATEYNAFYTKCAKNFGLSMNRPFAGDYAALEQSLQNDKVLQQYLEFNKLLDDAIKHLLAYNRIAAELADIQK